jgi:hypothetical protein
MNHTRPRPKTARSSPGQALLRNAARLLSAAGLHADRSAILLVLQSAPRSPAEGDHPDTGRFCAFLLAAAEARPMTQEQYRRFVSAVRFWLDEVPSWPSHKRQRLERLACIALVAAGGENQ